MSQTRIEQIVGDALDTLLQAAGQDLDTVRADNERQRDEVRRRL